MYAGAGIALIATGAMRFETAGDAIHLSLGPRALGTVLPAIAFWVVAGLSCAFGSSSDPRAGWVFRIAGGEPTVAQVNAVQSWVAVHGCLIVTGSGLVLGFLERHSAQSLIGVAVSWIVSAGLCWILAGVLLFKLRYVPFVEPRMPRNTDLAWILLR